MIDSKIQAQDKRQEMKGKRLAGETQGGWGENNNGVEFPIFPQNYKKCLSPIFPVNFRRSRRN